jgi:hypothetical protein
MEAALKWFQLLERALSFTKLGTSFSTISQMLHRIEACEKQKQKALHMWYPGISDCLLWEHQIICVYMA